MPQAGDWVTVTVQNFFVVEMDVDGVFVEKGGATCVAEFGYGEE
jgi:hypothetical protein